MRQLLIKAFEDAVARIKADMGLMPLTRWNEFVFRFMYSRAIEELKLDVTQFVECNRIDLVLHRNVERAFMEFKFYIHRAKYNELSGTKGGMKGGPSLKNRREFENCVKTLRQRQTPPGVLKLVALFYADPVGAKKTFEAYYGDSSGVDDELKIPRLASIGPFPSTDSEICNAKLYEVGR